ncbi:uncharacterized protein LOC142566054 [Dermacentor variabilis]|uniref:uncharacterized protein LOC142566054 n=1 Tax=Dermacentor variabilis TaxID=34621 RepID=UPI003F5B783C
MRRRSKPVMHVLTSGVARGKWRRVAEKVAPARLPINGGLERKTRSEERGSATTPVTWASTRMQRMRQDGHGFFYKFFRKTPQLFDKLLSFVAEDLTRQHHIRETPGAWRTTCGSIEQCFPTYPACDCLLKPAMLVTAACCGVPEKPQEPELL